MDFFGLERLDFVLVEPWYLHKIEGVFPDGLVVHRLAGDLAYLLTIAPDVALADALTESIARTCAAHEKTCDLSNPDSPSSTVTILRCRDDVLDYLALGDSPLLVNRVGKVEPILDERMANLNDYSYEAVMAVQNTPEGYYVASTMFDAAYQATCGTVPTEGVDAAALLNDGASRLSDAFQLMSREELFRIPVSVVTALRRLPASRFPGAGFLVVEDVVHSFHRLLEGRPDGDRESPHCLA